MNRACRAKSHPALNEPVRIGYEPDVVVKWTAQLVRSTRVAGALPIVVALVCGSAAAQGEPSRQTVAVVVSSHAEGLSAETIREAVGKELDMLVRDTAEQGVVGTVEVTVQEEGETRRAALRFTRSTGATISRAIDLPPEAGRAVEAIALLAGNLVRDEAGALIASLAPAEPAAPDRSASLPEAAISAPVEKEPHEDEATGDSEVAGAAKAPERPAESNERVPNETGWRPRGSAWVNLSLLHPLSLYPRAEEMEVSVQFGLLFGRVGSVSGFGFDALALHVDHDLHGVGFGSAYLGAGGDMDGLALSGLVAQAGDEARGVQAAGVLAVAGAVRGLQLAPVTVSGDVDGAQVGGVNVAGRVRGVQIGLVNVASEVQGIAVGLVNLGVRIQPTVWTSTTTPVNGGVMYRAQPGYTLVHAGWNPDGDRQQLGAALGVGHAFGPLQLDGDVGYAGEWDGDLFGEVDRHVLRYRLTAGVQATSWLSLFAGVGMRQDVEEGPDTTYRPEVHGGVQLL